MKTRKCEVAIVGAGTAGLTARRGAIKQAADVVMIESGPYGTMCALVGCMPSKLLVAAADVAHEVEGADRFGVRVSGDSHIDGAAVLDRVRRERDRSVDFVVASTEAIPEDQRLRGHARFVGPTTLEADGHTRVEVKAVVIATGSSPRIPPSLEHLSSSVLVNDDISELADLPESIAVVGTGLVGLELGQAMHRLGVRTSFFSHSDRLGPVSDPEVKASVASVLSRELDFHLNSGIEVTEAAGGGYDLRWKTQGGEQGKERFDRVLAAAGRLPNLEGLGLEQAGVELSSRGVPCFDPQTMQCGDLPIFLAGDATAQRLVLHEAADEGQLAGANAARFPEVRAHVRRTPMTIVFTDSQMTIVGTPSAELNEDGVESTTDRPRTPCGSTSPKRAGVGCCGGGCPVDLAASPVGLHGWHPRHGGVAIGQEGVRQ